MLLREVSENMTGFYPAGTVKKTHEALELEISEWTLGRLVVAADAVPKLLAGIPVDVNFVQERDDEVFVGFAGTARPSRSGKAINIRIEARLMTIPVRALESVISGRRASARLSSPAPVIDADQVQREAIDADLVRSFA